MIERKQRTLLGVILLALILGFATTIYWVIILVPQKAIDYFGPPDPNLDHSSRIIYSLKLVLAKESLQVPREIDGIDIIFVVTPGETANEVADDLAKKKIIPDPTSFSNYLVYKGIDRLIQSGTYWLNSAMAPVTIASELHDENPEDLDFSFLPGWRSEEISELLPTSGLEITPMQFLSMVQRPNESMQLKVPTEAISLEGYLAPGKYNFLRSANAGIMINTFIERFYDQLPEGYEDSLKKIGLTLNQAVILASIVEKETIIIEEAPLIASVFINRLNAGMPLQSDPTVQYAIGQIESGGVWWKNPLNLEDLKIKSVFNTYTNSGLPPSAICNPGINSLYSVLNPADSDYLFFRAACDGSGKHIFSLNYQDHLNAACK